MQILREKVDDLIGDEVFDYDIRSYEDNTLFSQQQDELLVSWFNRWLLQREQNTIDAVSCIS